MTEISGTLRAITIHPVKGEPGVPLTECEVEPEGLEGDRRKKAAVHLVSAADAEGVRANLVVDISPDDLASAVGQVLSLGGVVLEVGRTSGSCPGVYAEVRRAGHVTVGDRVVVGGDG